MNNKIKSLEKQIEKILKSKVKELKPVRVPIISDLTNQEKKYLEDKYNKCHYYPNICIHEDRINVYQDPSIKKI